MEVLGGRRAFGVLALKVALGVALIVLPIVVIWMSSSSTRPPRVEVHDEAGILQDDAVRASLEQVDFREDVHLVVLTLDVDYDADFDREVLDYARAEHPEWLLSSGSSQWDDDVIVLAASPSGRWVGCYVGEDVEVDADAQGDIRSAGEKAFRSGDWAGGFEDMARETTSSIGSRFLSFKAIMVAAGVVLLGVVELSALVRISISGRSAFERACRHCARVIRDYEVMRSRAGLIPADDAHGAQVLARFRPCERDYVELPRRLGDFGRPRGAQWAVLKVRSRAQDLERRAAELDSLNGVIAHASALFTRSAGWQQAWANEQGPIREDLTVLDSLCDGAGTPRMHKARRPLSTNIHVVRMWLREQARALDRMTVELGRGGLGPAEALDRLDSISGQIRFWAEQLARSAIDADRSHRHAERLRMFEKGVESWSGDFSRRYSGRWSLNGRSGSYDPASTIRVNPSSPEAGRSGAVGRRVPITGDSSQYSLPISGLVITYTSAAIWSPSVSGWSGCDGSGGDWSGGGGSSGSSSHF